MTRPSPSRRSLLALFAGAALAASASFPAWAQDMVSVQGKTVNMRSGPSTQNSILWELKRGYPLRVIRRQGNWLEVSDFENDRGWVARSLVGNTPHHVVKSRTANIRRGPGTNHAVVGQAEYGDVLRTREKRGGWVRVEHTATGTSGWVSGSLLWGW
ncbi:MAG TPA: SH3 domain-containing protein [Hydrogenophaga sp.]|uniref:SH3 domain-containing protein n=1 Tax=Hydrogenophaga sp. TaxID=1904254 RepID=UPI002C1B170C|nr:SH3 domain-containing protein [Hydrogenophaga sp.]HMN92980.1 SH3 domain-containing protein [Hydrogenophaga sp.]HMP09134.1 SH3 domain-containing protein [Hydrogenophaga sp.]